MTLISIATLFSSLCSCANPSNNSFSPVWEFQQLFSSFCTHDAPDDLWLTRNEEVGNFTSIKESKMLLMDLFSCKLLPDLEPSISSPALRAGAKVNTLVTQ